MCEISTGPYAYRLNPTYVTKPDEINENSPYLPELTFEQPIIQLNIQKPDLTIRQLAVIGASTWALLKRDAAIMSKCRQAFKEDIAQETWECLTGCRREEQKDASLLGQLHPSNIVLLVTFILMLFCVIGHTSITKEPPKGFDAKPNIFTPQSVLRPEYGVLYDHIGQLYQGLQ